MDFLKTCSTNILRVDDLNLRYAIYEHDQSADHAVDYYGILSELREANTLCSYSNKLYVFTSSTDDTLVSQGLIRHEEGALQECMVTWSTSEIAASFEDAIEQGLSYQLAGVRHVYKSGLRTWLSTPGPGAPLRHNTLIQLCIKVTAPATFQFAVLSEQVLLTTVSASSPLGGTVILSPSGISATMVEQEAEIDPAEEEWTTSLRQVLKSQGVCLDRQEAFVRIELTEAPGLPIPWPRRLCFRKQLPPTATALRLATNDDLDSLSFAQQWAETASDRQQALLGMDGLTTSSVNDLEDEMDLVTSPPFQYRPGISNVSGVYPTPPDGAIGNAAQPALTQDTPSHLPDPPHDSSDLFRVQTHDGDAALGLLARVPSVDSSADMDMQQTGTDDLFGEPDADLGSGEVDEDDFDFFDDQREHLLMQQPLEQSPIVPNSSSARSLPTETSQTPADHVMADAVSSPGVDTLNDADALSVEQPAILTSVQSSLAREASGLAKPLSPFDIRERLLPPPIPASMSNYDSQDSTTRRRSSFAPVVFNPNLRLGMKAHFSLQPSSRTHSSVTLDQTATPISSQSQDSPTRPFDHQPSFSASEEDSSDSSIDTARAMPPVLPWQTRKRKRIRSVDATAPLSWDVYASPGPKTQPTDLTALLSTLIEPFDLSSKTFQAAEQKGVTQETPKLETYFQEHAKDLLMVAQLVSEQAVTCSDQSVVQLDDTCLRDVAKYDASPLQNKVIGVLKDLLPGGRTMDPLNVALQRDRLHLPPAKGQPRPPTRLDTGPSAELFPLAVPYLRFQRADAGIEILPPALAFWDALSLGPHNLAKNIRLCVILPDHPGLQSRLAGFLDDLKAIYEGYKLGQLFENASASPWSFAVGTEGLASDADIYRAYQDSCFKLTDQLVEHAYTNPDYTFVIIMIDAEQTTSSVQRLCACFYMLYKTYGDRVLGKGASRKASDICLQILPSSLISSRNSMSMLSALPIATIAREIYDRCPPSTEVKITSPLPIATTPSLVLADPMPKRIAFQLTSYVPTDLLHEGSELHVAYAKSADGLWITAVWTDITGAGQQVSSFCLRGTTFAAVVAEIWDRSLSIMRARPVSWRLGIASANIMNELEVHCWREVLRLPVSNRVAIHASLVLVQTNPLLRIERPAQDIVTSNISGGVITPVSTPQSSGLIVSPEASGQTAPPTPAPTELSAEVDSDAHLVDLPDETWGMLLDPKYNLAQDVGSTIPTIAQGALVKHGEPDDGSALPVAGVSIAFTLRIRGNGTVAEDATAKQAEIILKELLTSYRGLSLLAKARGLHDHASLGLPLHVVSAIKGAAALQGLLSK